MKYILLPVCFLFFLSVKTYGQVEVDSLQVHQLDEVIVTSFKERGSVAKIPIAATSISFQSEKVQERIENLKDASSVVPNFFMPDYGSKLTSPVYIRGIGSRINSPSVGLYVDNIPYFEKASFDFNFFDLESITVLKGPQGTLYGRNTMGGLINITSLSPRRYQGTRINVSGGSHEYINANVSHYGKIKEQTTFSLAGNYHHSGGYFSNVYSGDKVDVINSESLKGRLCHQFSENFRAELFAQYEHSEQGGYPYALLSEDSSSAEINYDEYSSYRRDLLSTGLLLEVKDRYFTINATTAYQFLDDKQKLDQDFTPSPDVVASQLQRHHMLSHEFIMKSETSSNYQWLLGAFGFYQHFDNKINVDYSELFAQNFKTPLESRKTSDLPTRGAAFFHQSTLNNLFIKGLTAEAGIRFDYEKTNLDFKEDRLMLGGKDTTTFDVFKMDFWQVLPKFSLKYEVPSVGIIYLLLAKGYKTGGFNTSFDTDADKTFDPEDSWNYEAGLKMNFNAIQFDASFFYIDWRNQQIYQPVKTGGSMLKNAGHSVSKGFELSANTNITRNLNLNGAYGYTHACFTDYKRGTLVYDDNYIPYVPKHTVKLAANYGIHFKPDSFIQSVLLHLDYLGAGRLYWDDANKYSQDYYSTLNAKVSFKRDFAELAFWGRNLTDADYHSFYFESMGKAYAQKGKPFLFGADLFLKF